MIDPVANEAAIRYLVEEVKRLQIMLSQTVGNLALANSRVEQLENTNGATPKEVLDEIHHNQ
jgi:hypothetical protein